MGYAQGWKKYRLAGAIKGSTWILAFYTTKWTLNSTSSPHALIVVWALVCIFFANYFGEIYGIKWGLRFSKVEPPPQVRIQELLERVEKLESRLPE